MHFTPHTERKKSDHFEPDESINKGFMMMILNIWAKWTDKSSIIKAGKGVGITSKGISVDFMQKDRFAMTAALDQGCKTPEATQPPWKVASLVYDLVRESITRQRLICLNAERTAT